MKNKKDYKAKQEKEKFQYILKYLRKNKIAHFLDINLQQTTGMGLITASTYIKLKIQFCRKKNK